MFSIIIIKNIQMELIIKLPVTSGKNIGFEI